MSEPVVGQFYVRGAFFMVDAPGRPAYMPAVGTVIALSDPERIASLLNRGKIAPADDSTAARVQWSTSDWHPAKDSKDPNEARPNWVRGGER